MIENVREGRPEGVTSEVKRNKSSGGEVEKARLRDKRKNAEKLLEEKLTSAVLSNNCSCQSPERCTELMKKHYSPTE